MQQGSAGIAKLLFGDISQPTRLDNLLYEATKQGNADVIKVLIAGGVNSNFIFDGEYVIFSAIRRGDENTVKLLGDHGSHFFNLSRSGQSPLLVAVLSGQTELVKILMEGQAKASKSKEFKNAVHEKTEELVNLFFEIQEHESQSQRLFTQPALTEKKTNAGSESQVPSVTKVVRKCTN